MSLRTHVGSFNITTQGAGNTVSVTGLGFQPQLVFFFWGGRTESTDTQGEQDIQGGFGAASGTSSRWGVAVQSDHGAATTQCDNVNRDDCCICSLTTAGAMDGQADLDALLADGFRLIIDDAFARDLRIHYLALGGDEITNIHLGSFVISTAVTTQSISDPGFQPDAILLCTGDGFVAINTPDTWMMFMLGVGAGPNPPNAATLLGRSEGDGAASSATAGYAEGVGNPGSDTIYFTTLGGANMRAELLTMDPAGFTLNWVEAQAGSQNDCMYVAIKGARFHVDELTTRTDTTAFQGEAPFGPHAVLFGSACRAESASGTTTAPHLLSIGACDRGLRQAACGWFDRNAAADMDSAVAVEHDAVYVRNSTADPSVVDGIMRVTSMGDDEDFGVVMANADPTAAYVWFLVIGSTGKGEDFPSFERFPKHLLATPPSPIRRT